jgi:hypothetical protein
VIEVASPQFPAWFVQNLKGEAGGRNLQHEPAAAGIEARPAHRTGVDLKIEISPEDLARQLEERGLATTIFGTDKPTMIEGSGTLVPEPVEPRLLEGNGAGDVATRSRH